MDDLSSFFKSMENHNDLVDKMVKLLDRQTDHKLNPNVLLGFMGMFNLMSIMSVVKSNVETGVRDVGVVDNGQSKPQEQSLTDGLASLLKGGGSGQPDLMGLLGSVASKKKMNPSVLLSLMSMLNNQGANQSSPAREESVGELSENTGSASNNGGENKSSPSKQEVELKYDRKKGPLERG